MCMEDRFKLIPIVVILAAVFSGLIIFQNSPGGLFGFFIATAVVSLVFLTTIALGAIACGLHLDSSNSNFNTTCACLYCFGPAVTISSIISLIGSLLVIEGVFTNPVFAGLVNAILGVIYAIVFSIAIVYFIAFIFCLISRRRD